MIWKYRNFSSYNNSSISRFFHGHILFHLDNPDPVERQMISNPNPKTSKYPAGLDSKIRIICTTGASVVYWYGNFTICKQILQNIFSLKQVYAKKSDANGGKSLVLFF